ncbi:Hypothetical protein, putative [Bodo saltans]|uniref:Uncharacterized protein n=1 Tax=Bodo saltans TaxID=75058 RepID=A0A0S4JS86_BODSA|nr:Hypothetical protein, putative [Bodo saltans]|eukprot:CUG91390.1 Hypothetical protein, putative [Bodo saltans]
MEDYDRQYEFQLQLFVRSFCTSIVDDAAQHQHHAPPHHTVSPSHHAAVGVNQHDGMSSSGRREVSFINAAIEGDELSSGSPTPASTVSPTSFQASGRGGGGRRGQHISPSNHRRDMHHTSGGGARHSVTPPPLEHYTSHPHHPLDVTISQLRAVGRDLLDLHSSAHLHPRAAAAGSSSSAHLSDPDDDDDADDMYGVSNDMNGLVEFFKQCGPPKFSDVFSARAYLQQAHILCEREDQRRQRFISDVSSQWWMLLHRAAAPLHQLARAEWSSRQQVAHRETTMRAEVQEEYDLGCAVIRFLSLTVLHGAEFSQQLFEHCEDMSHNERTWRTRLVREELSSRAQITAAMRLLRSHPADRAWELVAVAQQVLEGRDDDTNNNRWADRTTSAMGVGTTMSNSSQQHRSATGDFSMTKSRYRVEAASRGTSVKTFPEVTPAMKALARKSNLLEESGKRSDRIRAFSAALHERLAKTKAEELAARSIAVAATKERNARHHQELLRAREADVVHMREQCRLEKLVVERQAYESRNPEVAHEYRSFLLNPDAAASRQGWHREDKAYATHNASNNHRRSTMMGGGLQRTTSNMSSYSPQNNNNTNYNNATQTTSVLTHVDQANAMLKSVPYIPKHQLSRTHKSILEESNRVRRPASGSTAMRKAFGGGGGAQLQQRPYSATLHHLSSIAGDHDDNDMNATSGGASIGLFRRSSSRPSTAFADFAAPSPSKHHPVPQQRSSTPPLDPVESALLQECEGLFRNMKQRSYHYAPPAPLLYTADGVDALQSRNLMGDDVEVHLLTPLERIVRWNLRAQLAFRNEQYGAAEIHLKNALTALHNAEKDRRRAARRRGRRSSQQGHTSDSDGGGGGGSFGVEESTGVFEPSTSGGGFTQSNNNTNGPAGNQNPHAVPSTAESWTTGYGNLSLQNVKMLTYTTKAFLERTLGRYRDALQDLQTVLKVQEQQQEDMAMHARQHQKAAEAAGGPTAGGGRRSVMIVSPRDDSEKQLYEHMEEYHCGVQPDTLVNISALLLQVGNRPESLNFGRRAVEMLTSFAAAENQRMHSSSTSPSHAGGGGATGGGSYQQRLVDDMARRKLQVLAPSAASPRLSSPTDASDDPALETPPVSARLREGDGVLLRHRQLFIDAVAALHNVAMTQSSEQVAGDVDGMARRRVGKASHAAALRLGRTVLGNDHAVVVRVESSARQVAQLLAQ